MKKLFIGIIFILTVFTCITGCGVSSSNESGSSDGYISFGNDKILDAYEEKELQDGITYKAVERVDDGDLHVSIIVYNNTDEAVSVSGIVKGYLNGERTNQSSQVSFDLVLAHSSSVLSFWLFSADSYEISNLEASSTDDPITKDTYSFENYKIDDEYDSTKLKMYFKFNSTGENTTEVTVLGFKEGKLVGESSSYINYVDENLELDYDKEITNSGEMGMAEIDYFSDGLAQADKLIYFISGFYAD